MFARKPKKQEICFVFHHVNNLKFKKQLITEYRYLRNNSLNPFSDWFRFFPGNSNLKLRKFNI